ncbi:MAG TPA: HAD-IG family 5'-nucleotidase [Myxococcales bacterium]|jgi:HAD superfamily 5'-nucleotidase-like hydrolase
MALFRPASPHDVLHDPELQQLLEHPDHQGLTLPHSRQIYTNRALKMDEIALCGFDMDYTLAVYSMRQIEELAFRMTLARMVDQRGYPGYLRGLKYDHEYVIRGLVVDKDFGNIFKMDRHNHVGRCYHGRRQLTLDERRARYQTNEKIRLSLPRFAWIDTLFSLPEACLYAEIIEAMEARREAVDFHKLYDDVRESIDEIHRDGSLKTELRKDLGRYINLDPELAQALHKLRSGGKKLFILTNSLWDYTDAVMSFLLDGRLPEYPSWRNYFDFVVVGAQKPSFFAEHKPFVELNSNGSVAKPQAEALERGRIYEGGNLFDFERMSGFSGDRVLYVGDHIYGDIIRNRKASQWRTCFVVQELEREIEYIEEHAQDAARLSELDDLRTRLDDMINHHKQLLNTLDRRIERGGSVPPEARQREKQDLEKLRRAFKATLLESGALEARFESGANAYWGLVFKEGNENSRFGEQVEDYADLYTSRVSNFLYYSPMQFFRSPRASMPHERLPMRRG